MSNFSWSSLLLDTEVEIRPSEFFLSLSFLPTSVPYDFSCKDVSRLLLQLSQVFYPAEHFSNFVGLQLASNSMPCVRSSAST